MDRMRQRPGPTLNRQVRDRPEASAGTASGSANRLIELQRAVGNAAVSQLLSVQTRPEDEPGGTAATTTLPQTSPDSAATSSSAGPTGATTSVDVTAPATTAAGGSASGPDAVAPSAGGYQNPFSSLAKAVLVPALALETLTLGAAYGALAKPRQSFLRDPGCDVEAPDLPTVPAPRTFTPDPAATLPAKEAAPDLSMIPSGDPWWKDGAAQAFGDKLADCYASRGLTSGAKVDKATKLAELQADFDQVVRGWFGRTGYGRFDQLPTRMVSLLQARRAKIAAAEAAVDAKKKKEDRRPQAEVDAAIEAQMQRVRFDMVEDIRLEVAKGTWGWMAERREKLDFDTIRQTPKGAKASLAELLTDSEQRKVVHDILVAKKKELTAAEVDGAVAAAQKAADARAKKAGQPSTPLTDDEKAEVAAKAERDRVRANWGGELRTELIKARTVKDAANLVVPAKSDVKGWQADGQGTRIHTNLVTLLKVLETEFPAGFQAGTYRINVEGDHASAGFEGRFRSLDMYPNGGPSRIHKPFGQIGFFDKQVAYDFAQAIDRATAGRGSYQILYNDFEVARELNKTLKNGRVFNVDNVVADKGGAANLNWHGPLVTHFHVDFAI